MRKYINEILGMIVIMLTGYILFAASFIKYPGEKCILDELRFITNAVNISKIIALFEIYYLYVTRDDFQIMKVLKVKNRRRLWNKQIKTSFCISLGLCTFVLIITMSFAMFYCKDGGLINWNQFNSSYALQSMGKTSNISFVIVILKALMILMMQTVVCFSFSQLIIWITDLRFLPLIFIIGAAISDIHPTYVPLFFSRFNYIITDWGTNSLRSINAIVRLFIIALCIYCCGYIYSEHKEFIEKGHK